MAVRSGLARSVRHGRTKAKRADYVLYYRRDDPLALVDAKATYHPRL